MIPEIERPRNCADAYLAVQQKKNILAAAARQGRSAKTTQDGNGITGEDLCPEIKKIRRRVYVNRQIWIKYTDRD